VRREGDGVRWEVRGREGREGERRGGEKGRREGEGRPPNVRDPLTPLHPHVAWENHRAHGGRQLIAKIARNKCYENRQDI